MVSQGAKLRKEEDARKDRSTFLLSRLYRACVALVLHEPAQLRNAIKFRRLEGAKCVHYVLQAKDGMDGILHPDTNNQTFLTTP